MHEPAAASLQHGTAACGGRALLHRRFRYRLFIAVAAARACRRYNSIDQSFLRGSIRSTEQVAVLRAIIIDMAHGLGLRTVAEGVETEEQWRLIAELGCGYAQGYLISRPTTAAELLPLLQASPAPPEQVVERTQSPRVLELRRRDT